MRALIIDEPWIGLILAGKKTWEMRKSVCNVRGRIGLIRKGSGKLVGVADLVASLPKLDTAEAYARGEPFHGIGAERQERARVDGWHTPWVLKNARPLPRPVSYTHPMGAVIWVTIDPNVEKAVVAQIGGGDALETAAPVSSSAAAPARPAAAPAPRPAQSAQAHEPSQHQPSRRVELTAKNIVNKHIYLASIINFFPDSVIGGSNKAASAPKLLEVSFGSSPPIQTDIAGDKKILRYRGEALTRFFENGGAKAGDMVEVVRTGPLSYIFTIFHR